MPDKLTKSASDTFTTAEWELIAEFLEVAAEEFSEHSSNDFTLPATEENRAICRAALGYREAHHGQDEQSSSVLESVTNPADEVFIYDDWLMAYFADRTWTISKNPTADCFTRAELNAIGMLLILAYEEHMDHSGDVDYWLSFPASDENKTILSASVEMIAKEHSYYQANYRDEVAEQIPQVTSAIETEDEIEIPDFWVMYYLANKCKKLSGNPTFQEVDFPKIQG